MNFSGDWVALGRCHEGNPLQSLPRLVDFSNSSLKFSFDTL